MPTKSSQTPRALTMVAALVALSAAFPVQVLRAQSVVGQVRSPTSSGVVTLRLEDAGRRVVDSTRVTVGASFRLRSASPGDFVLRVRGLGFQPEDITVQLTVGVERTVNVQLQPLAQSLSAANVQANARCNVPAADSRLVGILMQSLATSVAQTRAFVDSTAFRVVGLFEPSKTTRVSGRYTTDKLSATLLTQQLAAWPTFTAEVLVDGDGLSHVDALSVPTLLSIGEPDEIIQSCYRLVRRGAPSPIGLETAEPSDGTASPAWRTTIWFDSTAAIHELAFVAIDSPEQICVPLPGGRGMRLCEAGAKIARPTGTVMFRRFFQDIYLPDEFSLMNAVAVGRYTTLFREQGVGARARRCFGGPGCKSVGGLVIEYRSVAGALAFMPDSSHTIQLRSDRLATLFERIDAAPNLESPHLVGTVEWEDGAAAGGMNVSFSGAREVAQSDNAGRLWMWTAPPPNGRKARVSCGIVTVAHRMVRDRESAGGTTTFLLSENAQSVLRTTGCKRATVTGPSR